MSTDDFAYMVFALENGPKQVQTVSLECPDEYCGGSSTLEVKLLEPAVDLTSTKAADLFDSAIGQCGIDNEKPSPNSNIFDCSCNDTGD